jgi:hypothetical protein
MCSNYSIRKKKANIHVELKGTLNGKYNFFYFHKKEPKHAISYKRTNTTRCWDRKYYIIILFNLCKILTAMDAAEIFKIKLFEKRIKMNTDHIFRFFCPS